MSEFEKYTIPGTSVFKNKLGIKNGAALAQKEADFTTLRITELQTKPLTGAFTIEHLQRIHSFIFQDVYDFAGELRSVELPGRFGAPPGEIERSLNKIFDNLARDNRLKGFDIDEWAERSAHYLGELSKVQPFLTGNGRALREFNDELARENALALQWGGISKEELEDDLNAVQFSNNNNLKRLILMAMDPDPEKTRPNRGFGLVPNKDRGREHDLSI
jgi:cell filamentation protein